MNFVRDVARSLERTLGISSADDLDLRRTDVAAVSHALGELGRLQSELSRAAPSVEASDVQKARFTATWTLAHSADARHNTRAIQMLESNGRGEAESVERRAERWRDDFGEAATDRDLHYLRAVAHYNGRDYEKARAAAFDALRCDPECRQAADVREAAEEALARDGLVAAGEIAAVGLAVIGAAAATSKR